MILILMILNRVYSEHSNNNEDRIFEYSCRNVGDGSYLNGGFTWWCSPWYSLVPTTHPHIYRTAVIVLPIPNWQILLLLTAFFFCMYGFQAAAGLVGTMHQMGTRIGVLVLIRS
jgi:hypothetical protein